jgi:hypothetical protein
MFPATIKGNKVVGFEVLMAASMKMAVLNVGKLLPDYMVVQPRRQPYLETKCIGKFI